MRRFAAFVHHWLVWLLLGAVCLPGCNQATSSVATPPPAAITDAAEVLHRMATGYRDCQSYADHGRVVLSLVKDGQPVESTADFSIAFQRPNKLRMQVYQVSLACDGRQLHAALQDFQGQVLRVAAPKELNSAAVYDSDAVLAAALTQGIAGPSVPLALLTDEAPLDAVLRDAEKPKLLENGELGGAECYRVEVVSPLGPLVFWIDRENLLLRRLDYPTRELARSLAEREGPLSNVTLSVELADAQVNEPIDPVAFQFEVPDDARLVQQFEPPQPIVGQQAVAVAERSEPEKLRLTKLWECRELEKPGNVLAVEDEPGQGRLFVLDGMQTVVELDVEGQFVARHELKLPEGQGIVSFLRTAVSRDGRRWFAGSGAGVGQVHLFDDQWNTVLSFPSESSHAGIADVQLADLDRDGELELFVGYWGAAGVDQVAFDGERRWTCRAVENVFRLAVAEPDRRGRRQLLVSGAFGAIVPLDGQGRDLKPLVVGRHMLRFVYAADLDGDGQSELCAIGSAMSDDERHADENALIGFDSKGKSLWTYPLPAGLPLHASFLTETVSSGAVLGGREEQWIVAGADGSIHILSADGAPVDRFNYGAAQAGLAGAHSGGRPMLVVVTAAGVEAWQVSPHAPK